jgi:hypothetical protein
VITSNGIQGLALSFGSANASPSKRKTRKPQNEEKLGRSPCRSPNCKKRSSGLNRTGREATQ